MSTASLGVLVAALAVVVSAVFQYRTITSTRANLISQLRVDVAEKHAEALRDMLAQYIALSYRMHTEWRSHRLQETKLSAEYYERANRETYLRSVIRMYLDVNNEAHSRLLASLERLRDLEGDELWIDRAEKLVETARVVFSEQTTLLLGVEPTGSGEGLALM